MSVPELTIRERWTDDAGNDFVITDCGRLIINGKQYHSRWHWSREVRDELRALGWHDDE